MTPNILAIDVGLSNCKTALFDDTGDLLACASVPYPTYAPRPGWVEQDPTDWWNALVSGVTDLRDRTPEALGSIAAVSVTGHMHALVCLGPEGSALGRSLVLGDRRSLAEAEAISAELSLERIYALTGARMDASMPLAKLCWLRRHVPDLHRQARAFLACKDWVRHQLTGDLLTDPIDACGSSLYDILQGAWSPDLIALAGIRADQLPPVTDPCAIAGHLSRAAAQATGLQAGIPVVVGAGDDVEVLGNGLLGPGCALEHMGTTGSILTCADRPVFDPLMAVELYPHVVPGLWVLGGSVTAAGSALAWVERTLRLETPVDSYSPGSSVAFPEHPLLFVPHLLGERCPDWESHSRGAWLGLTTAHMAGDLRQAALEGIAFSLKSVLERIESLVGPQTQIMVSGKEMANNGWLALRANVYQRPLGITRTTEPTALGAAIVAAVGVGLYGSVAEALERVTGAERIVEPQAGMVERYERLYGFYRAASDMMRPLMRAWATG